MTTRSFSTLLIRLTWLFCGVVCPLYAQAQLKAISSLVGARSASDDGPQDGRFDADMPPGNLGTILDNGWTSIRTALEYELPTLPAGAQIQSASLMQTMSCLEGTHTVALHAFADDGRIALDDFTREGFLGEVTIRPIRTETSFDVTPLISRMYEDGGRYAEFVFREVSPVKDNVLLGLLMDVAGGPSLKIFYTIPEPGGCALIALASGLVACCRRFKRLSVP